MNSENTALKRNTGSIIAKCLVVFVVLGIVCSLSIWAWFTIGQTAVANGISIKSKGDGVQVSWDGVNYYDHLQALKAEDVSEAGGASGPAKNLCDSNGNPLKLSLVTGNGLNFFEPYLNRRTGTVLFDGSDNTKSWYGVDILKNSTQDNSEGKFVDIDLYFRGLTARDVYLAADSKVSPKNENDRISEYGAFSKDNIASASRIAFLTGEGDNKNCSFIWAPNADKELVQDESGYKKYTTTATQDIIVSGGGNNKIDGGVEDNGKTYYLWTFYDDAVVGEYQQNLDKFESRKFTYNSEYRYFTTEVTMYLPTYDGTNPSIPFFLNESSTKPSSSDIQQYNTYVDGYASSQTLREDLGQYYVVTNTSFNIGDAAFSNAFKIVNGQIAVGSKITFEVGYDPVNKLLVILNYQVEGGGSFDLGGEGSDVTTTVTYYPLENNVNCALINPLTSTALSKGTNYSKDVSFLDSAKNKVSPVSITIDEQFTTEKTGTGYYATYKFKSNSSNTYLTLTNGTVSFTGEGTEFTLEYKSGVQGPLIKAGDYYLVIDQGKVLGVKADALDTDSAFTVYTGTTYDFITVNQDQQSYEYYSNTDKQIMPLNDTTTPKLFTSTNSGSPTEKVGSTKIVTLSKAEGEEYYTAHVVMRVWVEGTDREAKTPLADGIFDISLHFTSQ